MRRSAAEPAARQGAGTGPDYGCVPPSLYAAQMRDAVGRSVTRAVGNVGNVLNEGKRSGSAGGIQVSALIKLCRNIPLWQRACLTICCLGIALLQLASLQKLKDTKSSDNKTNLLRSANATPPQNQHQGVGLVWAVTLTDCVLRLPAAIWRPFWRGNTAENGSQTPWSWRCPLSPSPR